MCRVLVRSLAYLCNEVCKYNLSYVSDCYYVIFGDLYTDCCSHGHSKGVYFHRAGPRERTYFASDEVLACIVTCGGLCPGLNTVIREIVHSLDCMYGVNEVLGIDGGYRGFYSKNMIPLTPKVINDIHKRGGTIVGTSRGGHDTTKIVDSIEDHGINQVYIIGGDGTQKGAAVIYEEICKRCLKVSVAGIPKTIDNDIPVIDKSFGFDTNVEEAQRAINAAHVEAESTENGIGVVKLMGCYCGFIAMYVTLASRDVVCCLIPESPLTF
ncbi:ATP-dependent 6-phosphofructokinase 7 [Phtheirospermum japonicum]|uniref:ATP-dependent 6-phosphofructokinase 7 n=1 Tax=Phtheirospermum japonicum TaxID=374723 RepID=A0A830CGN6_9LAMI|nr:ATP-dependent 6-phosphofructokinase 7 [Phtheirospermum japonicum]